MGILNWLKIGSSVVVITLAGYFYWNYQHRGRVIEAQRIQIQELEAAEKYYKAQPKIDAHTKEMQNEVKKAVEMGDIDRVRWLYNQLHMHKADKGNTTPNPDNGRTNK